MSEAVISGGATTWRDYVAADTGIVAIRSCTGASPCTAGATTGYVVSDHLGSVSVLTDSTGTVLERDSFDAWGARRNPDGSAAACNTVTSATTRGFTAQEMMDSQCAINFNARLYDPAIGRFMSADSLVPNPFNGQSFNRYSYVDNGPLSAIDPSGHKTSPVPTPDVVEEVVVTATRLNPPPLPLPPLQPLIFIDPSALFGNTFAYPIGAKHTNWGGIGSAFNGLHLIIAGQEAFTSGLLGTRGASADTAIEGVSKVFRIFGGAAVIGEQVFEATEGIVNENAPVGASILGATANSSIIIGTGIGADALIGAGVGSLFPGAGTAVGAIGGAGVGALVGFGLPSPSVTGQAILQGYYMAAQAEQFNEQNGIPMYYPF